jgi:ribosome-associated protein
MPPKNSVTLHEVENILRALDERKAVDVVALDLRQLSNSTDYFIIASGTSDTHVKSVSKHVQNELEKIDRGPHHVEGRSSGHWALLDFLDVVVHVFHPETRKFYQLERLWADAPRMSLDLPS